MGGRSRLRQLLDALDVRYELLSKDAPTMRVAVPHTLGHGDQLKRHEMQVQLVKELLSTLHKEMVVIRHRQNWDRPAVNAPVEILRRIFQSACSPVTDRLPMAPFASRDFVATVRELREARQTVSSVCRYWRDVVQQDSALWGDIAIEYANGYGSPSCPQFMFETALSGTRDLSVHLTMDFKSKFTMFLILEHLSDRLSRRTTSLDASIVCGRVAGAPILINLPFFSKLRVLRLGLDFVEDENISDQGEPVHAIDLQYMEHLREVVLDCEDTHENLTHPLHILPPQTCGITHLVLRCPLMSDSADVLDAGACINLINECQYLEKLDWSLGEVIPEFPRDYRLKVESQNYLTELSIAGDIPFSLLSGMYYPNLIKLRIHDYFEYDEHILTTELRSLLHDLSSGNSFSLPGAPRALGEAKSLGALGQQSPLPERRELRRSELSGQF